MKNGDKISQLIEDLKLLFDNTTVRLKITVTADEVRITQDHKHPETLRKRNISMRNIQGEFITNLPNP